MIDITYDFRQDTPKGKDPDKYSQTLKTYHQLLWSKELPNGEVMDLKKGKGLYYLTWKNFDFGSDSIIVELRYERRRIYNEDNILYFDKNNVYMLQG